MAKSNPKKMKVKELDTALKDAGVKDKAKSKKEKQEVMDEVVERAAIEARYGKLTVSQLKDMLRINSQVIGGNKQEVLERCIDGKIYGGLPRCPKCGGGILRVYYSVKVGHGGQGKFSCPGFYDDDYFQRCPYTSDSAERLPWHEA